MASPSAQVRRSLAAGRRRTWARLRIDARRRLVETGAETTWLVALSGVTLLLMVAGAAFHPWWPLAAYVLPLVVATSVLSLGRLLLLEFVVAFCLVVSAAFLDLSLLRAGEIAVVIVVMGLVLWQARDRKRLGFASTRGESMLVDLRDRLAAQSQLPMLPRSWYAEAVMRSAGGASFAGDFIVAAKSLDGHRLEVAVVDVSGKGLGAGTRALLLSGAFGGLLGSMPADRFLAAANDYLVRQEWTEGFATAIHLVVDLPSGTFEVRSAGHPPAVQFHAGSGRWVVHWTEGPVLGLVEDASYTTYRGRMLPGDALLLYTDGLVETPKRDISYGIDKLVGEAERLVRHGFEKGAARLVASVDSEGDDRALLLLHRQ